MATETRPVRITRLNGEQVALTTTVTAVGIPTGIAHDTESVRGAVLRCTTDFRYNVTPSIVRVLKTQNSGTSYTDYTKEAVDRDTSTTIVLNSQDTAANGDYWYVGSKRKFAGMVVDVGNTNSNASVMSGYYYNGSAWADASITDGTASGGAALAQDGNVTWSLPSDWAMTTVYGTEAYWIRFQVSAALDASVTIRELALLQRDTNRGYGYAYVPVNVPFGSEDGGLEAVVASGTGTLDVSWSYGGAVEMNGVASVTVGTEPSGTGAYTTPTHSAPTAGVASGAMLAANTDRLYALFVNDSDATVYLALGTAAVLNTGIRLNASGGSYEMSKKLGNLYTGVVNGISSAASKTVLVTEGV